MALGLISILVGGFVQSFIGSILGAFFLQGACALFNLLAGSKKQLPDEATQPIEFAEPVQAATDSSPYAAPRSVGISPQALASRGVPVPNYGTAFVICLCASFANLVVGVAVMFAIGILAASTGGGQPGLSLLVLLMFPVSLFVFVLLNKVMLPTTFSKSLIVVLLFLCFAIPVVIAFGVAGWFAISTMQ